MISTPPSSPGGGAAERSGGSYTIRLTGKLDTTSGCSTTDPNDASYRSEIAHATVQLDEAVPTHLIKDAVSRQIRPVYDRAELPAGFTQQGIRALGHGVQVESGGSAEFRGEFLGHDVLSPTEATIVEFRGLGLSATRQAIPEGEAATFGSFNGWLAPSSNGRSYRFVWHTARGSSWIGYELYMRFQEMTKAEFVSLMRQLWG